MVAFGRFSLRTLCGLALAALSLTGPVVRASDHANLEEGLPALVEDAYPIGAGGRELQIPLRYDRTGDDHDLLLIEPRLEWGFARNWQAKISVPVRLGGADKTGSGDIGLEAFYNFNQESLNAPALALSLKADFPTGEKSEGVVTTLKLIATRSLGRTSLLHRLHVNLAWKRNATPQTGERQDRMEAILGYSRRLAPDWMLVADYAWEQEREAGKESHLLEVGVRQQWDPLTTLVYGIGAGLTRDSPSIRAVAGIQRSF